MMFTLIRRLLVVAAILALAALNASAFPIDCNGLTLDQLIGPSPTYAACHLGDTVFSNFYYFPGVTSPVGNVVAGPPANNFQISGAGSPNSLGAVLNFAIVPNSASVTAGLATPDGLPTGQTMSFQVQYLVDAGPYYPVNDVDGGMTAGASDSGYDDSIVTFAKNFCLSGTFGGDPTACATGAFDNDLGSLTASSTPGDPYGNVYFQSYSGVSTLGQRCVDPAINGCISPVLGLAPITEIGVQDIVTLYGGTDDNPPDTPRAAITNFGNAFFFEAPEPTTLVLIGSALLGLGALRRKRV